jgi:putative thiamine transport system substrate-binding protein
MLSRLRRAAAAISLALGLAAGGGPAIADPTPSSFQEAVTVAHGQTVFFNAWGGDERINAYIAWVGERVQAEYGITLRHVKLADTAEAVARVLAEKAAGKQDDGSVDLIWINGENFAAMKSKSLLLGPFTQLLPNMALVDPAQKPTVAVDFTIPVDGMEAPWGMAQLIFLYDSKRLPEPPRRLADLLTWAKAHPGRFTYPAPPDFIGNTFLKQALYAFAPDPAVLQKPATDESFAAATAALWPWLEQLHPLLWRGGKVFPANNPAQRQLLADGEIDIALSFNPADASSAIAQGLLPDSIRTYVPEGGSIGNTHFVGIPFNAKSKAGAMVVANFLLSPEAQLRKQDPAVWGDPTVLAIDRLPPDWRTRFEDQPRGVATLPPSALGHTLLEPHPSWTTRLEAEWRRRYAQ